VWALVLAGFVVGDPCLGNDRVRLPDNSLVSAVAAISASGPSRHIALPHELGRFWSKADVAFVKGTPLALIGTGLDNVATLYRDRMAAILCLISRLEQHQTELRYPGISRDPVRPDRVLHPSLSR
jgi:hypothetical protein